MKTKYYCISEYSYLYCSESKSELNDGNARISEELFKELEEFALENIFLILTYKRGIGKILKAQNYVGIIQSNSGTVIEILPKIYEKNHDGSYENARRIFLKMLKSLKDSPFKNFNMADVKTANVPIFDVFINMFLVEIGKLMKKGIRSCYIKTQENGKFYRGKLLVSKNINSNIAHKERFFVEYDDFNTNTPENRLIKSTILYLHGKTNNYKLQRIINRYLFDLDEINVSKNITDDFSKCTKNRTMSDYDVILNWCNIFLNGNSFTSFKGNAAAYSLLFPMEKIFESYVAKIIKVSKWFKDYNVKTQHHKYYLIEHPQKFSLRPDIVIEKEGNTIILDTKWKLLNCDESKNYGISQSDLYQMYAYAKKYGSKCIVLIYPLNDYVKNLGKDIEFTYDDNIKLIIYYVDLENIDESMKRLRGCICSC